MNFVYPAFLWALFALSIPVIIHLFNFRRFKTIYFTNVKFLKNIQEETSTRNRLKHWLVLIARILALAFLIFAFAQPFIPSKNKNNVPRSKAISIYIDNSFSMESMQNDNRLLDIAKIKAEEIANAFSVDDKFQLITNDFTGSQQRLINKEELLQQISEVKISPANHSIDEVFKRQRDILNHANAEQKLIYLLSDFQQNAMNLQNDTTFQIQLIPLSGTEQKNISIDSIWLYSPVQMINQPSQLCVKIKNYGTADIANAALTLKINEQVKGIAELNVSANSEKVDTITFTVTDAGWQNGEVDIVDYPVTFDDVFYFAYKPVNKIAVLCINGQNKNAFIESVYGNNSLFFLQNNAAQQVDFNNLSQYSLIILNELTSISSGLADALNKRLKEGAGILIIPSLDLDKNNFNQFLSANGGGIFGDILNEQRKAISMNPNSTVFSGVFEKIPKNLSLPTAFKSFAIESSSRTLQTNIISFADGKPMLASYNAGNGNIYISASPLNKDATDLPVQGGLFVPFMYRIALLSEKQEPLYVTIGKDEWIQIDAKNFSADESITVKNKSNEFIPSMRKTGSKAEINVNPYAQQAGIYNLNGNNINQNIALNYNRSESELKFYDAAALEEKFSSKNISVIKNTQQNLSNVISQLNQGKPLWKLCIIFALLFLAVEIFIIRLLP